jgi:hypothetical protein
LNARRPTVGRKQVGATKAGAVESAAVDFRIAGRISYVETIAADQVFMTLLYRASLEHNKIYVAIPSCSTDQRE